MGRFHVGRTIDGVLSTSGSMFQRTERAGRADPTSLILPADADRGRLAPRRAGRSGEASPSAVKELLAADGGGDFLANRSDRNRNFPPPDDGGNSPAGAEVGGVSWGGVSGARLCQLRAASALWWARCFRWYRLRASTMTSCLLLGCRRAEACRSGGSGGRRDDGTLADSFAYASCAGTGLLLLLFARLTKKETRCLGRCDGDGRDEGE